VCFDWALRPSETYPDALPVVPWVRCELARSWHACRCANRQCLHVGTLATALIARIEQTPHQASAEQRLLRWSSAGHLPPQLLRADGTVQVLDSTPERLLGSDTTCPRSDREALVCPSDTVLFYTDGLVEIGRTGIDEGITRLAAELSRLRAVRWTTSATG
jgi:hypothetical protein